MKILIVGGAGFIGSRLGEKLLEEGKELVVIDNFNDYYDLDIKIGNIFRTVKKERENLSGTKNEKIENLKKIVDSKNYKLEYVDVRDVKEIERIFEENKIDMVINFSGYAGVRPSLERAKDYEEANIGGFLNLLEGCKKTGVKKFIQASSSSVYGNNKKVPFSETDIVDFPISPYAATKKACEVLGYVYFNNYHIDMIQYRFFTVYGPNQRPDLAIYKFTNKILKGEPIDFYGDGNTFRDYTYIDDIRDGILLGIEFLMREKNRYEIINIGAGNTISLKRMVEVLEEKIGKKAIINRLPMQMGDVDRTSADISKAKRILNYSPKVEFEKGIEKFLDWYMEEKK